MTRAWRFFALSLVGLAVGGVILGLYVVFEMEREAKVLAAWESAATRGVTERLSELFEGRLATLTLRQLEAAPGEGDAAAEPVVEFRGAVLTSGESRALVGRAALTCAQAEQDPSSMLATPGCWRLGALYVDGELIAEEPGDQG